MVAFKPHPGLCASVVAVFVAFTTTLCAQNIPLQIGQNFTATSYEPLSFQGLPPDCNGAVGPNEFVEFINGTFAIFDKSDPSNSVVISDLQFWANANVTIANDAAVTDPRIIYDPSTQRWFATQVDANANAVDPTAFANNFLFAVSAGSDPNGPWYGTKFKADSGGRFADFPTLGLDSQGVYISGDMFHNSVPIGPTLYSFPKADVIASNFLTSTWFGVMSYSTRGQVLQPATCIDGSTKGNILSVGDIGNTSAPHSNLVSFAVQNAAGPGAATLSASTSISVSPYFVPDNADVSEPLLTPHQPSSGSTDLAANDARLSAKVYGVGGVLYAVQSTQLGSHIVVRWYRINATNSVLIESGTIADTNLDLFFPSIAANSRGTVVIACNGSSSDTPISCYALIGRTSGGVTTFGPLNLLQSGLTGYTGDDELLIGPPSRWGDYSSLSVDPNNPTHFWTIQMYPSDSDVWSTQITELITAPQLTITQAGANVIVSWPSAFISTYQLQINSSVVSPSTWSNVTQSPLINGDQASVTLPAAGTQRFFRLLGL